MSLSTHQSQIAALRENFLKGDRALVNESEAAQESFEERIARIEQEMFDEEQEARIARTAQVRKLMSDMRKAKDAVTTLENPMEGVYGPFLPRFQKDYLALLPKIEAYEELSPMVKRTVLNSAGRLLEGKEREEKRHVADWEKAQVIKAMWAQQEAWHPSKISVFKGAKKYSPELSRIYSQYLETFKRLQSPNDSQAQREGAYFCPSSFIRLIAEFKAIKHPGVQVTSGANPAFHVIQVDCEDYVLFNRIPKKIDVVAKKGFNGFSLNELCRAHISCEYVGAYSSH